MRLAPLGDGARATQEPVPFEFVNSFSCDRGLVAVISVYHIQREELNTLSLIPVVFRCYSYVIADTVLKLVSHLLPAILLFIRTEKECKQLNKLYFCIL